MSAERYKITDDGTSIIIAESNGIRSTIDPVDGQHLDDAVIGAIRQQSADIESLRAELAAAVAKRNEWAGGAARLSSQLGNLLAVIHRDGGHYEAEHGTEKACADAVQRICDARAGLGAADELAMLVRRLARALQKSSPDSDLPKTAMDYLSIAGLAGSPMRRDE